MKSTVIWDVTVYPDSCLATFLRNILLPLSGFKSDHELKQQAALHMLVACFLDLFFDPENGGSTFLRNVGKLLSLLAAFCLILRP
jgi:hypothetical protein